MSNIIPMQTKPKYGRNLLIVLLLFATLACVKDKINSIENNISLSPSYSLPIGSTSFDLESMMGSPGFDTIPADTTLHADSSFTYDSVAYLLPEQGYFDTVFIENYSFSNTGDWVNQTTYLMFRLNIENAIPSEILLQVSFLDDGQNTLFSLFEMPGLLVPPAQNGNSVIISPYDTDPLTEDEIVSIPYVQYVQTTVYLGVQSTSTGTVYMPEQYFDVQMGFRIGLDLETSE